MSTSKPTVVFVTGAWHPPALYSSLTSGLEEAGYKVLAPSLPSVGTAVTSFDDDVSEIRKTIKSATDKGEEVVLLMHSYGGIAGSAAAQGLSKSDGGGVVKMVYLAAFAVDEGVALIDALGGSLPPWIELVNDNQLKANDTKEKFYNDVDAKLAAELDTKLVYQAHGSFLSKQTYAAWKHINSAYIVCDMDNAIPAAAQEAMSSQPDNKFSAVEHLNAGHSPFLSMPKETISLVSKLIG